MASVRIEVIYALADAQQVVPVEVEDGATALAAIEASAILVRHPEIDRANLRLGRFGQEISREARVADGDRIEILRPLVVSPMEARRLRARRPRTR
jgi:putative ubiquitin-RnfH superfamily antitoxin RatB of RatAB toxin-antitoxin module